MKNYYEILGVDASSDNQIIRAAYVRMLRKFTPENNPDKFKEIREAYETLSNPKAKAEYDVMSKYKDEIDTYMSAGMKAMEDENYTAAITEFKKILIIHPTLDNVRKLLATAMMNNGQLNAAIEQFKKLTDENNTNATYLYYLAIAYRKNKQFDKAEQALVQASKLDRLNPDIIIEWSDLYVEQEKFDSAVAVLRKAIDQNKSVDSQDTMYLFQLVLVYLRNNKMNECEAVIKEIEGTVINDKEAAEYISMQFGKLACTLIDINQFNLAYNIVVRAVALNPANSTLIDLKKSLGEILDAQKKCDQLLDDNSIPGPIKGPIFFYIYGDNWDDDEREKKSDENIEDIDSLINSSPHAVVKGVNDIKAKYSSLYKERKAVYDEILRIANARAGGGSTNTSSSSSGSPTTSSCYVATAAFGTPWASEINKLRAWRDNVLVNRFWGRAFIRFYYTVGPYLAKLVRKSEILKAISRKIIYQIIRRLDDKQN